MKSPSTVLKRGLTLLSESTVQLADVSSVAAQGTNITLLGRMPYPEVTLTTFGQTQTTHSTPQATQSPEISYLEPHHLAPIRCISPLRHRRPLSATTRQQSRPYGHCRSETRLRPHHRVPTIPVCGHSQRAVPRQAPVPHMVRDHPPTYIHRHMKATVIP